jgi:TorA maturation chaperone TorD
MRDQTKDQGLDEALRAAGGMRALARRLGISQPAISAWKRVPSERVLAVEAATGVARGRLRPDLYPDEDRGENPAETTSPAPDILDEDLARAEEYELIGALLWRAPTAAVIAAVGRLRGDASELGVAHLALAEEAARTSAEDLQRAYFDLFVGVGRGEFLPYASYYLTGFLNEKPLAAVRADMERLGLAREVRVGEPEDHIAILCDVMRGLIAGEFGADGIDDRLFFERHLKPWAQRFFADLEVTPTSGFYRAVGRIGRVFMDVEAGALALAA